MKTNQTRTARIFSMIFLLSTQLLVKAQVSGYIFSQSNGTYTAITGGSVLGNNSNDDEVFNNNTTGQAAPATNIGFSIGFNFTYNGVVYDKFAVSTNGWIVLGTGTFQIGDQPFFETPISTAGPAGFANAISALGVDLGGQGGGSLRFQTIGTTPNQTLVVQWKKYLVFGADPGYDFNFQIRLNETTNSIDVIYGSMINPPQNGESAEVGLRGATNADFNNRSETTDWSTTTAGAINSATCDIDDGLTPASGLTFTWTPAPPCSGVPSAGVATSNPLVVCASTTFDLSLIGSSANTGLTYQWQSSADSSLWSDVGGAMSSIYSTTENVTTYFRSIVSCGAFSDTSEAVKVTFTTDPTKCYCYMYLGGGCDNIDHIDTVKIATTTLFNPATGCADLNGFSYSVYPASGSTTATLEQTKTYTLSVTTSANNIISAWIDYDRSGTFDTLEWVQVDTNSTPDVASTVSITIPGTAQLGQTGMRIRSRGAGNQNYAPDACTTFGSGETEDYIITISTPTSIKKNSDENTLEIYPNPSHDIVNIVYSNQEDLIKGLKITNISGQTVFEEALIDSNKEYRKTIDVLEYPKGIYFLQLSTDKKSINKKIIIQ